jgi:hypothetical protein
MSVTNLIIAVIFVSLLCISTLWFFQIKKQRAIERARKTIIFTSQIAQIHQIVDSLAHFLDDSLLAFLAKNINESIDQLKKHNIEPDKRSQNTQEQARLWISEPKKIRKQARSRKPEKQQKRLLQMKSIIQFIRQALSRRSLSRKEALSLADSTKIGKIKLACYYYQQGADKAIQNQDAQEAIKTLKKIKALLAKIDPLPSDLKNTLDRCETLLKEQQDIIKESRPSGTKRLEDEFDKQEELDQDWQKKQLYDP